MHQYVLNLVCLFDSYADSNAVDAGFYQDLFILVSCHCERVEEDFRGACCFDLGYVMSFGCLGSEIRERQCGSQRGPHTLQIRAE